MEKRFAFALIIISVLLVACPQAESPTKEEIQEALESEPAPLIERLLSISIVTAPASVEEGKEFLVTWKIEDTSTTTNHTAVHYGTTSVPGELDVTVAPAKSGYPSFTPDFAAKESAIPGTFTAKIKAPLIGTMLYLRPHVIINGKHFWGAEKSVRILEAAASPSQSTAPAPQEIVEADDNGFYPSSLTFKKGSKVSIFFKVKPVGVYYAGLDFRSSKFNSPSIAPGGSWGTPEFIAEESFVISSWWPASGVKKSEFNVVVNP